MKNGETKEYYSNGSLCIKCNYINGVKDGDCLQYYENGKIFISSTYINGKLEGEVRVYSENGVLAELLYYKNNMKMDSTSPRV
jgi:antitoxin component YwqK of YwqJK toxin-antitoxin module